MKQDNVVTEFFYHCVSNEHCFGDLLRQYDDPLFEMKTLGVLLEFLTECSKNVYSCLNTAYIFIQTFIYLHT